MGQGERLVCCVHPGHLGNSLIPEDKIKCQTWSMPNGVCIDCYTDNNPSDTRGTVGFWMFSNIKRNCNDCPARGY